MATVERPSSFDGECAKIDEPGPCYVMADGECISPFKCAHGDGLSLDEFVRRVTTASVPPEPPTLKEKVRAMFDFLDMAPEAIRECHAALSSICETLGLDYHSTEISDIPAEVAALRAQLADANGRLDEAGLSKQEILDAVIELERRDHIMFVRSASRDIRRALDRIDSRIDSEISLRAARAVSRPQTGGSNG